MATAVKFRTDYSAAELRRLAKVSKDANQSRRLLSLAAVLDGMSRADAARIGGMDRQTLAGLGASLQRVGPGWAEGAWNGGHARGCRPRRRRNWRRSWRPGPDPAVDGVVRWRRIDLQKVIRERFGVDYHERHVGTLMKAARLLACERPAAPPGAGRRDRRGLQKNFARTLSAHLAELPKGKPVEIWFQDEARIGQKNGIVRQWARRGTRPRQPADQRYKSAYLFGAICPARGTGAALALPFADTEAMQLHLDEISRHVAPGAHAVLLLDRAGWHTTRNSTSRTTSR